MTKKNIVYLEIFTFQGMSMGAQHYYGSLHCDWDYTRTVNRITHILSEGEAARTNTYRRRMFSGDYAELTKSNPGDESDGFETREDVIARAKEIWLDIFPDGEVLCNQEDPEKIYAHNDHPGLYISSEPESESVSIEPADILKIPEPIQPKPKRSRKPKPAPIDPEIKKAKPKIEDFPSIEITVKAYNTHAEDGKPGLASFVSFATDVSDDKDNDLGMIAGGLGVVVVSVRNGPYFQIKHEDIWNAIQEQIKEQK